MLNFLKKTSGGISWIVVFLGNPGSKYTGTRHNVGFMTADKCEKATGAKINRSRFKALTDQIKVGGEGVLLMKPQTYMNLSGDAVAEAASFYKVPAERVIVISDDVSLPVGKLRIRAKGSAGGHNGLKSIIARLGSDGFPRIKMGVGAPPHPDYDMADWVLGSFKNQDAEDIDAAAKRAWEAVESIITEGVEKSQSRFN
ncbi:MAG: aminoacyl-tRNA hydrolase [Oscillospiraceae bacterium]|nr:aminoacyl-tRNA hydrolase [Oscillospiraceae bacterium]